MGWKPLGNIIGYPITTAMMKIQKAVLSVMNMKEQN